jgi:hypothetical protein
MCSMMDSKDCILISDDEDVDISRADLSVQVIGEINSNQDQNKTDPQNHYEDCHLAAKPGDCILISDDEDANTSRADLSVQVVGEINGETKTGEAKTGKAKTGKAKNHLKLKERHLEQLQKEANRANAASKATQNCPAIIDKRILQLINDPDEANFKTLFEESSLNYRLTDYPKFNNCVTWEFKRTEVENESCIVKTKETDLILAVMDGSEYVRRLLLYRDDPKNSQSLYNFVRELKFRSQAMIVILVYNLSAYLRTERLTEAKNYQKRFKERFEGGGTNKEGANNGCASKTNSNLADLEELRLTLQIDLEHNYRDWKLHIEFREKTVDVVSSIVRYTKSIAIREVKKKEKAESTLDWAINMDKEKAIDPSRSTEDLTRLWIAQLQQFTQITLPIAKTIAAEYPSPQALLDQYESLTHEEAQDLLAELHVQRNLKRQVGQSISRRIYRFLTSKDPNIHIDFD